MQHNSTHNDTFNDSRAAISMAIARLRLPLIIGVVLIHSNVPEVLNVWHNNLTDTQLWAASAIDSISLLLNRTVTSVFFFISGFLFFLNANGLSFSQYKEKLRRRATTLLVPYMLWNAFFFFLHSAKDIVAAASSGGATDLMALLQKVPTAFWNYDDFCPADLPLWYVRDLMVVVLFTPLIRVLAKGWRAGIFIALLFCWLWLLPQWRTEGINPQAFLFFSLGATFSINRISPIPRSKTIIGVSAITLVLMTVFSKPLFASTIDEVVRFIAVGAMIAVGFGVLARCEDAQNKNGKQWLSDKIFFIYAAHAIFAGTTVRLLGAAIPADSNAGMMTIYVLAPLITFAATMTLYYILSIVAPKFTNILNGKR